MNEKRDNIYIYLWEEFNTIYVGRTVNPKSRHYQHKHNLSERTYKFSSEHHVEHPNMIIIENDLTIEEGAEREKYWVNYYRENCSYNILNKTNGGQIGKLSNLSGKERREKLKLYRQTYNEIYYKSNKEKIRNYLKEYYKTHKEEIKEQRKNKGKICKIYSKDDRERMNEYMRVYREKHKEKIKEANKKYREEHKEKIKDVNKKYREEHKDELKLKKKIYRENHKEEIKIKKKEYYNSKKQQMLTEYKK